MDKIATGQKEVTKSSCQNGFSSHSHTSSRKKSDSYKIKRGSFQFDPATKLISSSHSGNKRKQLKPDQTLYYSGKILLVMGFVLLITLIIYNLMYNWWMKMPRVSWLLVETQNGSQNIDTGVWMFVISICCLVGGIGCKVASGVSSEKNEKTTDSKMDSRSSSGCSTKSPTYLKPAQRKPVGKAVSL